MKGTKKPSIIDNPELGLFTHHKRGEEQKHTNLNFPLTGTPSARSNFTKRPSVQKKKSKFYAVKSAEDVKNSGHIGLSVNKKTPSNRAAMVVV